MEPMSKNSDTLCDVSRDFLELGEVRFFGKGGLEPNIADDGWSGAEDAHVWNDGLSAKLAIKVANPVNRCVIIVKGKPFIGPGRPEQRISLFANGYCLGMWSLGDDRVALLEAAVEPEQWFRREDSAVLNCVWHLPDSVSPMEMGGSIDHRLLGFCFQSIVLQGGAPTLKRKR
jgi:hypothetical protein